MNHYFGQALYQQKIKSHFYFYLTVKLVTIQGLINSGVCSHHQHTKSNYSFDLSRNYQIFSAEENTRGFPNRSFILRSPCVHRSLSTRVCAPLAFCIRSLFTVHISFTKFRSAFTHRSLCVRSAFVHRLLTVRSPFKWESRTFQGLYQ